MTKLKRLFPIACLLFPTFAQAQMSDLKCDDSTRMKATLVDVLGATRQSTGLRDPDTVLEIWVTARNSEWLIVQSYSNGTSCIVAMGEHWQDDIFGPA